MMNGSIRHFSRGDNPRKRLREGGYYPNILPRNNQFSVWLSEEEIGFLPVLVQIVGHPAIPQMIIPKSGIPAG